MSKKRQNINIEPQTKLLFLLVFRLYIYNIILQYLQSLKPKDTQTNMILLWRHYHAGLNEEF